MIRPPPRSTLFPYPTLFRSGGRIMRKLIGFAVVAASAAAFIAIPAAANPPAGNGRIVFTRFDPVQGDDLDRKSTRLNSSHSQISYAVFCLKKKRQSTIIASE